MVKYKLKVIITILSFFGICFMIKAQDDENPDLPSSKMKVTQMYDSLRNIAGSTPMILVEGGYYKGEFIESFFIDIHPVTVEQYVLAVDAGICPPPPENDFWSDTYKRGPSKLPITNVSYYNARTFGDWISKQLPTEKQWEYAAKCRKSEYIYPWGTDLPDSSKACWLRYDEHSDTGDGPCEVMSYPPNELGIYDMVGNLWEMTSTFYNDDSLLIRMKGGAWYNDNPEKLKIDNYGLATPYHRSYSCDGFRFIRPVKSTK